MIRDYEPSCGPSFQALTYIRVQNVRPDEGGDGGRRARARDPRAGARHPRPGRVQVLQPDRAVHRPGGEGAQKLPVAELQPEQDHRVTALRHYAIQYFFRLYSVHFNLLKSI